MKLFYVSSSPYVRKVLVAAIETGLRDKITLETVSVAPLTPNPTVAEANPMMKVPTMLLDDGTSLFDSRVICEYLDTLHSNRKMVPQSGADRWRVLRMQAMADGALDAGLLIRYENAFRPKELHFKDWLDAQGRKALQALDTAQKELNPSEPIHLGQIALACAIGWFEFRKPLGDIRPGREKLFAWYDQFVKRPSLQATIPTA